MPRHLVPPLVAGILAAALFVFVFGLQLGFLFMFLPSLPLFYIGLGHELRHAFFSALVATVGVAAAAGAPAAILFFIFIGLPACYLARESLKWQPLQDGKRWFPIGLIFMRLTLYACVLVALIVAFYAGQPG
ncbi:MAG: hypothetical protein KGJ21_09325, partial [Pseudomonadota bacterium]|nr:hypothetical protein [Pseudomonadota bacterium]